MADGVDDSLRIEVELSYDAADRKEAERRKKYEEPIRVPIEYVQKEGVSEPRIARSFGGQAAPLADVSGRTATGPLTPTLNQQVQSATVLRGGSPIEGAFLGGAGLGAGGRIGSATTNTFYGQVGYNRLESAFGSVQALPGYGGGGALALRSGAADPFLGYRPALVTPPPDARGLAIRSAAAMAGPALSGEGTPESPYRVAATRVGQPFVPPIAPITSSPTSRGPLLPNLRGYFGAYAGISAVGSFFEGQNAAALNAAQSQGDTVAFARGAIANDPTRRFVEGIPLVGGVASSAAEFITGSRAAAERTITAATLSDAATGARLANLSSVRTGQVAARVAEAGLAGEDAANIALVKEQLATYDLATTRADVRNRFSTAAQNRLAAANINGDASEAAIARAQLTSANSDADAYIASQRRVAEVSLERFQQTARDAAETTNTTNFYNDRANAAELSGRSFDAQRDRVLEATERPLREARIRRTRLADTNADRGLIDLANETVRGIEQRQQFGLTAANQAEQRFRIGQGGGLAAGALALQGRNLASRLQQNQTAFQQSTVGVDPLSPDYFIAVNQYAQANAGTRRDFATGSLNTGIGLATQRAQTQALLSRNPYAADAAGITGNALSTALGIFNRNDEDRGLANQALEQGQDSLRLSAQNFGDAFRATEVDAFRFAAGGRNTIDPTAVFGQYNEKYNAIDRVKSASNGDFVGAIGKEAGTLGGSGNLETIIKNAVEQIVSAIKGDGDNGDVEGGGWVS